MFACLEPNRLVGFSVYSSFQANVKCLNLCFQFFPSYAFFNFPATSSKLHVGTKDVLKNKRSCSISEAADKVTPSICRYILCGARCLALHFMDAKFLLNIFDNIKLVPFSDKSY